MQTTSSKPSRSEGSDSEGPREGDRDPVRSLPRWVWLAGAGGLLAIGWLFILIANRFHLTAPVVFVCLGYGAGVAAVYTLFRTGASAVSASEEGADDASWGRPVGARGELEREKRAMLKAIKEAEFDLQMGKLSKADAEAMIASYRAQAIAVIKEIDRKESVEATAREEIEREVRARLTLAKGKKAPEADKRPAGKKADKGKRGGGPGKKAEQGDAAAVDAVAKADAAAKADERIIDAAPEEPKAAAAVDAAEAAAVVDAAEAAAPEETAAAVANDASGAQASAKEATP